MANPSIRVITMMNAIDGFNESKILRKMDYLVSLDAEGIPSSYFETSFDEV